MLRACAIACLPVLATAVQSFLGWNWGFKTEETQAESALQALMADATSEASRQIHKGMRAPFNQAGYEESLGNLPMTAFVTKYCASQGLQVLNADSLQGFVMYYDGTCHKKSFDDLVHELSRDYRPSCHGLWLRNNTEGRKFWKVGPKEFRAAKQTESLFQRAAAYEAAKNHTGEDSRSKLKYFVKNYVKELKGKVVDTARLDPFVNKLVMRLSNKPAGDEDSFPLDDLTDALYDESEIEDPFLVMPVANTRKVELLEAEEEHRRTFGQKLGVGALATLDQSGYEVVAQLKNTEEMASFVRRTVQALNLKIKKDQNVYGLSVWYDQHCAKQSYGALESELQSIVTRPEACGGGWLEELGPGFTANKFFSKMHKLWTRRFGGGV